MSKNKKMVWNVSLIVALLVLLFVLEQIMPSGSMLFTVLKKGAIYALVAVSMNLLNGFTGLFSLGQAGFMLLGAYTYAILTIPAQSRGSVYQYYDGGIIHFAIPAPLALIAGGLIAAAFAFLIGLPVLRLKSDYLAIATLGFAEIIRAVFQWDKLGPLTNGSNLLRSFPTFQSVLYPFIVSGICIALIVMLINSTYGRAFKAIRDDEIAAEAMGINLAHHKRLAFVISSFLAGISGGLLAMYQTT
ncbi:MAG: branched-chain amino acid ABC transporter permease, partial [Lachnospiraceae bacterium]|nr:branched-chain amino acid ABC transporter permease [Lachnospiraceae bacterium]